MDVGEQSTKQDVLENLFLQNKTEELRELLAEMPLVEVAEFLEKREQSEVLNFLNLMTPDERGMLFSYFTPESQLLYFRSIEREVAADVLEHMSSDVRADLYQSLESNEQVEILPYLKKLTREDVIHLSSYPQESAGGIMTTDFATILEDMSVGEAIEKIRSDAPTKNMVYYVYVVDKRMVMTGFLTLKDIILAHPKQKVSELVNELFVYADVYEDRESVARKILRYDLVAIPILNSIDQLVGIVRHDDAMEVILEEQTEDIEKMMGILPSEEDESYLALSVWGHFKKRIPWLISLAALGLFSGLVINKFHSFLESLIILAVYLPLMASTGGNAGSQAAAVVIRSLALGEIKDQEWLLIIWKEFRTSILLSICVGSMIFSQIVFFPLSSAQVQEFSLLNIGLVIALAISLQVISSTVLGAALPLLVRKFGGDPAVVASPAITTTVDITGILIYFSIASSILALG